jgi:hypothetical protein
MHFSSSTRINVTLSPHKKHPGLLLAQGLQEIAQNPATTSVHKSRLRAWAMKAEARCMRPGLGYYFFAFLPIDADQRNPVSP